VDDMGGQSSYLNCIFVDNKLDTGLKGFARYELAVNAGGKVTGCFINGTVHDIGHVVSAKENVVEGSSGRAFPPPNFNKSFVPEAPEYKDAGYRPVSSEIAPAARSH